MRLRSLTNSASFRLMLAYAGLFTASAIICFVIVYVAMIRYAEQQIWSAIEADMAELTEVARTGGLESVALTIQQKLAGPRSRPSVFLIETQSNIALAGNIRPIAPRDGWMELAQSYSAASSTGGQGRPGRNVILAKGSILPGGAFILVGHDTTELTELSSAIRQAFIWAGGAALALGLVGGALVSSRFLRRVETIRQTSDRIIDGNLSERVPVLGRQDEFDRLAQSLNRMLDQIKDLMEGMRQVTSDVAHDLRTPLARLQQGLERTRAKAASVGEYEAAVDDALTQTDHILRSFSALLRIAQIEAGSRRAGFSTFDLSHLFEMMVETYAAVAQDNGQHLTASIEPGIAITGDRELVTQMVANIIENAIHHTPAGTLIVIDLKRTGPVVTGSVADNGPGIPEAQREHVFRRFFRLDSARSTPGSGLGLSLVAAVAELHGFKLSLKDNNPGLVVCIVFA